MIKTKVLYISSVLPDTSCGAHIAIYRHFVLRDDFDISVAGFNVESALVSNKFAFKRNKLAKRLSRSRLSRLYYNLEYFTNWFLIPKSIKKVVREEKPEVIFTVPDNIHTGIAYQLSRKFNIPLVADFQDLFPLSRFIPEYMEPYKWMRSFLLRKFKFIQQKASWVFYTSDGMKDFFSSRKNHSVLYPIGDDSIFDIKTSQNSTKSFTIVYAGNCYGAYGRMLLRLAKSIIPYDQFHLKIFPVGKDWSDEDVTLLTDAGIYQQFLPFEKLKIELAKADAFLTVMSFEEDQKAFVSTSFTTKWLDYAPYGKPIFVWGPPYSSATIFAKKYECGIVTEIDDEQLFLKNLKSISKKALDQVGSNTRKVSESVLNPKNIHSELIYGIKASLNG